MKFILFVEGHTEEKVLLQFLKKWLDPRLKNPVGIKTVRFEGWQELVKVEEPPAKLLNCLYSLHISRSYKKVVNGKELFGKLNPDVAYKKCPGLQKLLDKMLDLDENF